jgi:hypothetical protein
VDVDGASRPDGVPDVGADELILRWVCLPFVMRR